MMTSYFITKNKALCCGCRACEQTCLQHAVSIVPDKDGFLYPVVDESLCNHCGACERVCIYSKCPALSKPKAVYAVCSRNTDELKESSSGGAFSLIAEYVLEQGGLVVGCAFDNKFLAKHVIVSTQKELSSMRGSKYVQSDLCDTYSEVKSILYQGRRVLYTGTPCQIDGLYRFLGSDFPKLVTVDLICHGVPSPGLFQNYLTYLQERENGILIDYRFRNKSRNGWSSRGSYTMLKGARRITKRTSPYNDYFYHYYYMKNAISRMTCYNCPYARQDRIGDFSIGDYWNIHEIYPEFDCSSGASLLLVNSNEASRMFELFKDKMHYYKSDIEAAKKGNGNLKNPSSLPPLRLRVFENIRESGFLKSAKKDCRLSHFMPALLRLVPRKVKIVIKRFR